MEVPHVIESGSRCPIIAIPRRGGGWSLNAGRTTLHLSRDEIDQFLDIVDRVDA